MCTQQWHFNRENEVLSHQMKGFLLNHQTNQPSYRMKLVMYPLKFPLLCHYSWFNHHYTDKPWQTHTLDRRIGLWENFNRKALYLMVKTHGFPVNFPNKTNPVIGWFGPMFFFLSAAALELLSSARRCLLQSWRSGTTGRVETGTWWLETRSHAMKHTLW